jgi:hypothetical protein
MKLTTIALSSWLMLVPHSHLHKLVARATPLLPAVRRVDRPGWFLQRRQERCDGSPRHGGHLARLRVGRRRGHYRWRCDRWTRRGWIFQCD